MDFRNIDLRGIAIGILIPPFIPPSSQTFNLTGAIQTFTVPSGVSSITVKMWGGAGGTTTAGSGSTPGNSSDPDRGTAGQGNLGASGNSGLVIISW